MLIVILISKNISMELFMCKINCGMLCLPKVKLWNAGRVFELLELQYMWCSLKYTKGFFALKRMSHCHYVQFLEIQRMHGIFIIRYTCAIYVIHKCFMRFAIRRCVRVSVDGCVYTWCRFRAFCRLKFTTLMRILRNLRAEEFTLHLSFSIFTVLMHGVSILYISKWYIPNSKIMKQTSVIYIERRANKYTWKKCKREFQSLCR